MAFKFKNIVIGLIFMSVAIFVFADFYVEMGTAYGTPVSSDPNSAYNVLNNITSITDQQEDAVRKGSVDQASLADSTTNGVLAAMDFFLSVPALLRAILANLTSYDIPPIVITGLITAFITLLVLIIISLVMKTRPEI